MSRNKARTTSLQSLRNIIEKNLEGTLKVQALNYIEIHRLQIDTLQATITIKNEIIKTKSAQIMELNERFLGKKFDMRESLEAARKGSGMMKAARKVQWKKHKEALADLRNKIEKLETEAQTHFEEIKED